MKETLLALLLIFICVKSCNQERAAKERRQERMKND
jgi:hypothetical protein